MRTAVGVFADRGTARQGVQRLERLGFPPDHITVLSPGHEASSEALPTTEGERPGVLGAAILGSAGAAFGGALETSLTDGVPKDEAFVYLDAAREDWWLGLRSAERERYEAAGNDFDTDESAYRRGFQFALGLPDQVRSSLEAEATLRDIPADEHDRAAFRRGVERGLAYRESMRGHGKRAAA